MIAVIIPAHNEEKVIAQTIANVRAATPPPDKIIVVADGCTDTTVEVSNANGAIVFQCNEASKGGALKWLFSQDLPELNLLEGLIVILDADSTVKVNFFSEIQNAFANGTQVVQSFVQPVGDVSPISSLAAYSEVLSQVVDDDLRSRLGWSAPLRGTGMVFRLELLRELLPHIHTYTEDIELSLLLAQRGVRVNFLRDAVVYDPKPSKASQISRQRARWLQGQKQVWGSYWRTILSLCWRGPEMWWLLSALSLLKPKTLFALGKLIVCVIGLLAPVSIYLKLVCLFLITQEIVYYVGGLLLVPLADRARYARALLVAPLYVWVWVQSIALAWRERGGWLRARD